MTTEITTMTRRLSAFIALCALASACNQTTIQTPIRSFDRPSDVALTCTQFVPNNSGSGAWASLPLDQCRPELKASLTNPDDARFFPQMRALVVNSARGELAVVDIDSGLILDLNLAIPGFGFLPVGKLPEHVRVTSDGCRAATTNANSCDLAVIDVPTLFSIPLLRTADGGVDQDGGRFGDDVMTRIVPNIDGRAIGARPAWLEMEPSPTVAGISMCAATTAYRAWVAFPSCEIVAEVVLTDPTLAPGRILRALRVGRGVTEPIADLSTISCPVECGNIPGASDAGIDPAVGDGGAPTAVTDGGVAPLLPTSQGYPATIALDAEGPVGRIVIGDAHNERVSIVPFDVTTGALGTATSVSLSQNAVGARVVRVSPRSPVGKFLYVVARDGTVRVVDLDRSVECETNPDPRYLSQRAPESLTDTEIRNLGCFPLGDPATPPRSPYARTPGIELPADALARDVAFVHLDVPPPPLPNVVPASAGPALLVGDFAWVIGSDGRGSLVNIYDACPAPNVPQPTGNTYTPACASANVSPSRSSAYLNQFGHPERFVSDDVSHHLRPGGARFFQPTSIADASGAPRIQDETNPLSYTIGGLVSTTQTDADGGVSEIVPHLVPVPVPKELVDVGATPRLISFPDPDHVRSETWTLSWEGVIPTTRRTRGRIGVDTSNGDLVLEDSGATFCGRGVRAGDIVSLIGCDVDADCNFSQVCLRDPSAASGVLDGMCVDRGFSESLQTICAPLLRGQRTFPILSAKDRVPGSLDTITDRLVIGESYEDQERTGTCSSDSECTAPYSCLPDSDGARRCLRACKKVVPTDNPDMGTIEPSCAPGFQCADSRFGDLRCLKAPIDPQLVAQCLNDFVTYEVRMGNTFSLLGTATPYFPATRMNETTHECESIPPTTPYDRLRHSRVLLDPPACPALGTLGPAGPTTTIQSPLGVGFPAVCTFAPQPNRQLHIENTVLSFGLELPSPPSESLTIQMIVVGGSTPLQTILGTDVTAQQPRVAVVAPDRQTVFVIDEGKQPAATGLRGQLLRLFSNRQIVDTLFKVR